MMEQTLRQGLSDYEDIFYRGTTSVKRTDKPTEELDRMIKNTVNMHVKHTKIPTCASATMPLLVKEKISSITCNHSKPFK